jgi:hypothetical protein
MSDSRGIHEHIVQCWGLLDQFWPPIVPCYSTEDALRIGNSLIIIPITRNYNHSQLLLTLSHIYTAYNHTRSWLQSLITLLHWLTSQLSISVSNYHRLYIFTRRNSRRELTPRIHFLRLLLNNSLAELTSKDFLLRYFSSSYKPSIVRAALLPVARSVSPRLARWAVLRHCV